MIKKAGSRAGSPACQVPRYNHPNCLGVPNHWLIITKTASLSWPMLWSKLQAAYAHHRPPVLFIPDEVQAGFVTVEEAVVLSAIDEIISNASLYASEQIVVIADKENDRLNLSICDDGPGFSPEALKQATTAYYAEGSIGGHIGYGLYQVEQTLGLMDIDLELKNDSGACVCLRLPLKSS